MAQFAVCNAVLTQLNGVVSCSEPWVFSTAPPSDLSWLESAFTFDLALFSLLLGTCIVVFIMGHWAGHVARNLGRL